MDASAIRSEMPSVKEELDLKVKELRHACKRAIEGATESSSSVSMIAGDWDGEEESETHPSFELILRESDRNDCSLSFDRLQLLYLNLRRRCETRD